MLHKRSQVFGSLHSAKDDDPALDGFPFSSFVPLKKASRSTFDIFRTARASHSRCHSSDHLLTGCPVISEIAVVSREYVIQFVSYRSKEKELPSEFGLDVSWR